jgi:peptidoglycan/LPS O-acetylase OafA/YrhL
MRVEGRLAGSTLALLLSGLLAGLLSLLLGAAVAVAALATHRSPSGAVVAMATTLVAMWSLRCWWRRAVLAFAAGWSVAILAAVAGRGEGDYVLSSDPMGWLLIGFALVVLVTGGLWSRPRAPRSDSGSVAGHT